MFLYFLSLYFKFHPKIFIFFYFLKVDLSKIKSYWFPLKQDKLLLHLNLNILKECFHFDIFVLINNFSFQNIPKDENNQEYFIIFQIAFKQENCY